MEPFVDDRQGAVPSIVSKIRTTMFVQAALPWVGLVVVVAIRAGRTARKAPKPSAGMAALGVLAFLVFLVGEVLIVVYGVKLKSMTEQARKGAVLAEWVATAAAVLAILNPFNAIIGLAFSITLLVLLNRPNVKAAFVEAAPASAATVRGGPPRSRLS